MPVSVQSSLILILEMMICNEVLIKQTIDNEMPVVGILYHSVIGMVDSPGRISEHSS